MSDTQLAVERGPEHREHFRIVVNGREKVVDEKELTFDEVVALAFDPVPTGPYVRFTITYRNGPHENPHGTLVEGQRVFVKDGMVFNVAVTDKS